MLKFVNSFVLLITDVYLYSDNNKQKETMMTLALNKKHTGYYTNQIENIRISVSEFKGSWSGTMTDENETEDSKYNLFTCYGKTKKQVVNQIVTFLTK